MAETVTKTGEELFGETKTAAELFGETAIGAELFQAKGETPSGDETVFGAPVPFKIPQPEWIKHMHPVLTGEKNWDSLFPMFDRIEFRNAMVDWGDYDESGKRAVNSIYFADQLGIKPELAFDLHDRLALTIFNEEGPPDKAFERIKNRFNNGQNQVKMMDIGYDIVWDILKGKGIDQAKLQAIKQLQSRLKGDYREDFRAWYEQMMGATAEQLPFMWEGIKAAPVGSFAGMSIGVIMALILGQAGPQALIPEEAVTVPGFAAAGIKIGGGTAAGVRIGQLEAGGQMLEFLEMEDENGNKIDPTIAAAASLAVGSINGAIEMAQWSIILRTFGIGTKVFQNAAGKVTAKLLAEGTIKQIIAENVLKFGGALSAEVLQEVLQESSNVVFGEMAKEINNLLKGTDIKPITAEALKERFYEITSESLKGFPLLLGPGTVFTTTGEIITAKPVAPEAAAVLPIAKISAEDIKAPPKPTEAIAEKVIEQELETPEKIDIVKEDAMELEGMSYREVQAKAKELGVNASGKKADIIAHIKEVRDSREVEVEAEEEPLTVEETAALEKMEAEIKIEDAEIVKPSLYIGNVTRRMKVKFAEIFNRQPKEVKDFTEEGFPTKRTGIEMTRGESRAYLEFLEEDLLDRLDRNEVRTENDLAWANADWGDIVTLREILGMKKEHRPFRVIRAEKHKMATIKDTKSRMWAAIKPSTIEDTKMTVGQVLGVTIKRMAQAARHAFSIGKKEGITLMRQHFRAIKQQERVRKQLKNRINKLIRNLTAPVPKSVDFFYREAIENLRGGIDFKARSEKVLRRRERMQEFLERATPEQLREFPVKLAQSLLKKDFRQYTIKELEQLANEVGRLKKLGKTKQKARLIVEKAERQRNIKAMVKTLTGTEKLPPQPPQGFETDKDGVIKRLIATWLWTLRIPRILDWIDGRKGTFKGLAHTLFYGRANEQYDAELRMTDGRHDVGTTKMEELGISDRDLVEAVDFSELSKGFSLLKEQMMGVYIAVKNQLSLDALVHGNKITQQMADVIISNLDQKFKDLADWIVQDYNENYSRLRRAHIEFANEDLGYEANYSPIVRLEKNDQVINEEIANQLLQRVGLRKGYAQKGFTIDRKHIVPEHQKKIDLRLVSVWRSQVAKQEHYIHFAKLIKDMRAMLVDKDFSRAVTEKLGHQGMTMLNNWVSRVANPNIYRGFSGIENLARQTRLNIAMAYLAFNLITIGKQLPSIILYAKDTGLAAMISSITEFAAHPVQMWERVRTKDPQVKHAFIERELEELKRANQDAHQKIVRKIGNVGMLGIGIMDGVVRTIGWNAVYLKSLANGMNEAEAIREAQHATLRTQPAAHAKDLAQLYTSNETLNWFTLFTNQLNNLWNITTYDTFAYWNNKNYQASAASLMAVAINAMVIWMIANKRLPEDEDDLLEAASDQAVNMIPLVGKSIMAGKRGWGESSLPPFEAAKSAGRVMTAKDKEKAALRLLETGAALKGVPVVGIKRGAKFLETGKPIELVGGKKSKLKKAKL